MPCHAILHHITSAYIIWCHMVIIKKEKIDRSVVKDENRKEISKKKKSVSDFSQAICHHGSHLAFWFSCIFSRNAFSLVSLHYLQQSAGNIYLCIFRFEVESLLYGLRENNGWTTS